MRDSFVVGISLPRLHLGVAIEVVSKRVSAEEFLHVKNEDAGRNQHSYQHCPRKKLHKEASLFLILINEIADNESKGYAQATPPERRRNS